VTLPTKILFEMRRRKKRRRRRCRDQCTERKIKELEAAGLRLTDEARRRVLNRVKSGQCTVDCSLDLEMHRPKVEKEMIRDLFSDRERSDDGKTSLIPIDDLNMLQSIFGEEQFKIDDLVGAYFDGEKSIRAAVEILMKAGRDVEQNSCRAAADREWLRRASAAPVSVPKIEQHCEHSYDRDASLPGIDILQSRSKAGLRELSLEHRRRATAAHSDMVTSFREATRSVSRFKEHGRAVAGFRASQGRERQNARDAHNEAASRLIFAANNEGVEYDSINFSKIGRSREASFDLHGLFVTEALKMSRTIVDAGRDARWHGRIRFVTGLGLHSGRGRPKLRPALLRFMKKQCLRVVSKEPSAVIVNI